jgi:hypothetical protein
MKSLLVMLALTSIAAGAQTPARKDVLELAVRAADWQLAHMDKAPGITSFSEETYQPRSWQKGAFWVGMTRLADIAREQRFADAILANGRATQWQPGPRTYHADDHVIGPELPLGRAARRRQAGHRAIASHLRRHPGEARGDSPELRAGEKLRGHRLPAPLVLVRRALHVARRAGSS